MNSISHSTVQIDLGMIILFDHSQPRWFKVSLSDQLGLKTIGLRLLMVSSIKKRENVRGEKN